MFRGSRIAQPFRLMGITALLLALVLAPTPSVALGADSAEQRTVTAFEAARGNPLLLHAFLRAMPKGGDLHNHPTGSEYAEQYIQYAADEGLCVLRESMELVPPPCDAAAARPPVSDALRQQPLYDALVDAWSMRDFEPASGISGHDQFFGTFGRFGPASSVRFANLLANIRSRAASENLMYLELMFGVDGGAASALGGRIGWDDDLGRLYARYQAEGMDTIVTQSRAYLDAVEAQEREVLACDSPHPDPGCRVTVRYLQTGTRILAPERVFAQLAAGFALAAADSRVVGVNLVAPEDAYVARKDYRLHMAMLDFLHQQAPQTAVALHAGELAPGLVPPEDLRFHIREAVQVAHARRIGHGVDVFYEDDPFALLADLAQRNVLIEIALLSNAQILGIKGDHHPFPLYRQFGVPVALATDDMGVSRATMTDQYQFAVETYSLDYLELKRLVRSSLEYAFVPGDSLWGSLPEIVPVPACSSGGDQTHEASTECRAWLDHNERARLQWQLELDFAAFESQR
jgi:adenosine deaminase